MPTIDLVEPSPVRNKRFRAVVVSDDGVVTRVDFGQRHGETFIDHKDLKKKQAYWKRHYANETERKLIDIAPLRVFCPHSSYGVQPATLKQMS
jgi:hypothetical protein